MTANSVGVVVPTLNSKHHLKRCLTPLLESPLNPAVLVVDSSSVDGTVELARELRVDVAVIPRSEFNHGATREFARKRIGTDIVVMMTPDAYAESPAFLEPLVRPIEEGVAAVSYARQLPHEGAGVFEAFPRLFNYSAESQLRGAQDLERYGSFTFFCSNSCAAWSNHALNEVGGFPATLVTEDSIATAKLLFAGYRVAYVAESRVHHSHHYSLMQEFARYFDVGYARERFKHLLLVKHADEAHGVRFVRAFLSELYKKSPALMPYGMLQIGMKYAGYKLGRVGPYLSPRVCRRFSGQDYYWTSSYSSESVT